MFYTSRKVAWLDLCIIPIYVLGQIILPIGLLAILTLLHIEIPVTVTIMLSSVITSLLIVLFVLLSHRHHLWSKLRHHLSDLRRHVKLIALTYLGYLISNGVFLALMSHLPEKWQFKETGNQDALKIFFEQTQWLPIMFIGIVIAAPIMEELLFRHLLIGELGKKFNIRFMSILSVILFALLHMQAAQTLLEIVPYLLLGSMFVITYVKSNGNIAVSIVTHMFNNLVAFIAILFQM
ncbi:CPBP family intramembrane glutamic endopeptidase [Staphylococcus americanisciuri]|uniref:CPBP family intramembrane metalloprotease n=1 Tax=Staphylococcus americanisciuri TaxID=2973940 RepID=A0ABT2F1Z9_9STAP|nr:type II CAAX endopeptidase family protein [Staphylococcus americanisciuri]MCS4486442.1 CPBP family intramembrane metalloprotease [Staphylococcus americanisciuri]